MAEDCKLFRFNVAYTADVFLSGVGIPYGKPCFSKYKGVGSSVDATVCNERRTRILEESKNSYLFFSIEVLQPFLEYRLEVFGSAMYSQ